MARELRILRIFTFGAALLLAPACGADASVISLSGDGAKLYSDVGQFVRDMPVDLGGSAYGITRGVGTDVLIVGPRGAQRFDGLTGADLGRFADLPAGVEPSIAGGLGATYRPGGELVAAARLLEESHRFDATTGAYLGTVGTPGVRLNMQEPSDIVTGPDGDLYVGTVGPDVLRYDGTTYAPSGIFATNPLPSRGGHLGSYAGHLAFGPDGALYASDYVGERVVRFDGLTGAFLGAFTREGALAAPGDLAFGPAGDLLVVDHAKNQVLRLDGMTGEVVGTFIDGVAPMQLLHVEEIPVPEPATWATWALIGVGALASRVRRLRDA